MDNTETATEGETIILPDDGEFLAEMPARTVPEMAGTWRKARRIMEMESASDMPPEDPLLGQIARIVRRELKAELDEREAAARRRSAPAVDRQQNTLADAQAVDERGDTAAENAQEAASFGGGVGE